MNKLSDYKKSNLTPEQAERIVREHGHTLYWHTFEDGWHNMDPAPAGSGHWVPDHVVARLLIANDELTERLATLEEALGQIDFIDLVQSGQISQVAYDKLRAALAATEPK